MTEAPNDSNLLVQFERDNIKDDYRRFYSIKRNNFFSSVQGLPEHWEFFSRLDEIWRQEISDLEVATNLNSVFPIILYINAHAKIRISMELAFANCMPEGRSILRDAVENVAYAHYMLRDPSVQLVWMNKDKPDGKEAFNKAFKKHRRTGLFAGIPELHQKFAELSEAGSHPTMLSFANRLTVEDRDSQRHFVVSSSGAHDRSLFAKELFSRLLTTSVMEKTFCEDYKTRFQFDARLMQMRHDFEIFKEGFRRELIARYGFQPPPSPPVHP